MNQNTSQKTWYFIAHYKYSALYINRKKYQNLQVILVFLLAAVQMNIKVKNYLYGFKTQLVYRLNLNPQMCTHSFWLHLHHYDCVQHSSVNSEPPKT